MLAILLALMIGPDVPDLPGQWAQFSREVSLRHIRETVNIATGDRGGDGAFRYLLRRTKLALHAKPEITWADSATCPAVRSVIVSMRGIQMPSPAPYGLEVDNEIVLDGTEYSLTAPSSDSNGELTIRSNEGSSLAAWVNASLKQLEACWKA